MNHKKKFLLKRKQQLITKIRKTLVKWNKENKSDLKLHFYVRDDRIHYTEFAKKSSRETIKELRHAIGLNNMRLTRSDKWLIKAAKNYDIFI